MGILSDDMKIAVPNSLSRCAWLTAVFQAALSVTKMSQ